MLTVREKTQIRAVIDDAHSVQLFSCYQKTSKLLTPSFLWFEMILSFFEKSFFSPSHDIYAEDVHNSKEFPGSLEERGGIQALFGLQRVLQPCSKSMKFYNYSQQESNLSSALDDHIYLV